MRHDELYLADIVEAADAIASFIDGVSREAFDASELIRSAVLQKLMIIGEAAARISGATRGSRDQVQWADIAAFRNIAIHAYFAVDWSIVWNAATAEVPVLRNQIADILDESAE